MMKRRILSLMLMLCLCFWLISCSRNGAISPVSQPIGNNNQQEAQVPPDPGPVLDNTRPPKPLPTPSPEPDQTPTPAQVFDDADLTLGAPVRVIGKSSSNMETTYIKAKTDPGKKLWIINANPWAVQTAEGLVAVEYTGAGKLIIDVDLKNIDGTFGGYPSIIYGRSPWSKAAAVDQSVRLPAQIKQIQQLTCVTDQSLTFNEFGGNIAYDLWLTENELPDNPNGGLELMVWFWHDNTQPLGTYVMASAKQIMINGVPTTKMFNVYEKKQGKNSKWDVVTFVLNDFQDTQFGKVEIDMLDFIKSALVQISRSDDLYLQDIEFGVEFTNQDQDFSFELDQFRLKQTLSKP